MKYRAACLTIQFCGLLLLILSNSLAMQFLNKIYGEIGYSLPLIDPRRVTFIDIYLLATIGYYCRMQQLWPEKCKMGKLRALSCKPHNLEALLLTKHGRF